MIKNLILNPFTSQTRLLKQAMIVGAIALAGFGVHQVFDWHEITTLPTPVVADRPHRLTAEDRQLARTAWRYFEKNHLSTGLVSSAADFPATTMWDVGSQFAGMVAARELGMLSPQEFDKWMQQALVTLAKLPLYRNELPNKAYNAQTLIPVSYGQLEKRQEIGFSSLDLGRLAQWLDIVAARYPQHAAATKAVSAHWNLKRVLNDGQLMGTDARTGEEAWSQEGRLGYEQYAAYGLKNIGVVASKSLDSKAETKFISVI